MNSIEFKDGRLVTVVYHETLLRTIYPLEIIVPRGMVWCTWSPYKRTHESKSEVTLVQKGFEIVLNYAAGCNSWYTVSTGRVTEGPIQPTVSRYRGDSVRRLQLHQITSSEIRTHNGSISTDTGTNR